MAFNQEYLDQIAANDSCGFLKEVSGWNNHRPLLYLAIKLSETGSILELGCGEGSTNHLHCIGENDQRRVFSYDYNEEWLSKYEYLESDNHAFLCTQDSEVLRKIIDRIIDEGKVSVCLVDHSPGEVRWEAIEQIANIVPFIVIHDSESAATGYMLNKIWSIFKYRINNNTVGACATLVSNFFDVTQFNQLTLGNFTLETKVV